MRPSVVARFGLLLPVLVLLFATTDARSQESDSLESIMVTGSRISYRDLLDTPAVAITRPGDYLLLPLNLFNDTRSEQGRKDEIHATIQKMLARAGQRFEIVHGSTFTVRLDKDNYRIALDNDAKRPDANQVALFLRTSIGGQPERAEEMALALRAFVEQSERVGRTEIEAAGETALSLNRPERFRHEIIKAIAEDTDQVRRTLGQGCKVSISGLSSRIEWERVSMSELMLYIPYSMDIGECAKPGG
jgi:hypothetical protein